MFTRSGLWLTPVNTLRCSAFSRGKVDGGAGLFSLNEEYSKLAQNAPIDWSRLAGKTVFVTGGTGLIGGCCIRLLLEHNRLSEDRVKVVALVRDADKFEKKLEGYSEQDGLELVVGDLTTLDFSSLSCDFVIHAGCPTSSDFFMNHPAETALTIVDGTRNMLEFARASRCESFVYVSSMEVYGDGNSGRGLTRKLGEQDVGYVNPLNIRSCYPEGKRMAELLTCAYAREYDLQACIVRLAQTFGPGVSRDDKRVFMQFARAAMNGEDIVLKTTGESTRMYSYTTDAVTAIFAALLNGAAGRAYNAANEATYSSVREMAEMVLREHASGVCEVRIEVDPNAPYPPEHHLPLDTASLQRLGWEAQVGLSGMFKRLIAYLRD